MVKIRYEQAQPEVQVDAADDEGSTTTRTDRDAFLRSLPSGLDEVYRSYLEQWESGPHTLYWGKIGFSLRLRRNGKLVTLIRGYPTEVSVSEEKTQAEFGNPEEACREYLDAVDQIPAIRAVFQQGRKYARYDRMSEEDLRIVLPATDFLAERLGQDR